MKTGNGFVRPYYEMLHPANKDDLDEVSHDIAGILESLPATGHVWADMLEGDDQNIERAIAWACSHGIMQKTTMGGHTIELESVRFWIGQLNHSKMKNVGNGRGTRRAYAEQLEAFDGWLSGTKFPAERGSNRDGKTGRSFSDVEELLRFCEDSDHGAQAARRAVRQYLAELAESGYSLSTAVLKCAAIKSYFAAHDMQVDVRVDRKRHASHDVRDDSEMNLLDFYKMMISGGMDAMTRAIMMVKFQAGLDSSTMADRFNFEGYPQIVRHFGMEDYAAWDLDRCPVPIKLVRVKTGMQYTTFIDRDAVVHLQDYLRWKEDRYGKHDGTETAVRDPARDAGQSQLDIDKVLQGCRQRGHTKKDHAPHVQGALARGEGPSQEHPDRLRMRAVRSRPRVGARAARLLREAGRIVSGDAAQRVRQGLRAPERVYQLREVPRLGSLPESRGQGRARPATS